MTLSTTGPKLSRETVFKIILIFHRKEGVTGNPSRTLKLV